MSDNDTTQNVPTTSTAVERMSALSSGVGIMSTFKGNTMEEKKSTLQAVTNAVALNENLDKTINLVHVVTQAIELTDEKTGEVTEAVRVILIDADGTSYAAVSNGIMGSLRDIFGIMGNPAEWAEPLAIQVVEKRGKGVNKYFKIELV